MDDLATFLDGMTRRPVHAEVKAFARVLAERHPGTLAVLAYGSALRDSSPAETLIDFYVLVDQPQQVNSNAVLCWLGQRVPPNVHYAELTVGGTCTAQQVCRDDAGALRGPRRTDHGQSLPLGALCPTQSACLVRARCRTGAGRGCPCNGGAHSLRHGMFLSSREPWKRLFENTYRTELRPESGNRAALIVSSDADYYAALGQCLRGTARSRLHGGQSAPSASCGRWHVSPRRPSPSRVAQTMLHGRLRGIPGSKSK
jgi:hypothetical protein